MSKNQLAGTANNKIASSVSVSPNIRYGIHARIKTFDTRKMALAGACTWNTDKTLEMLYSKFNERKSIDFAYQLFDKGGKSLIFNFVALLNHQIAQHTKYSGYFANIPNHSDYIQRVIVGVIVTSTMCVIVIDA